MHFSLVHNSSEQLHQCIRGFLFKCADEERVDAIFASGTVGPSLLAMVPGDWTPDNGSDAHFSLGGAAMSKRDVTT